MLLSARQLGGTPIGELGETHHLEHLCDALLHLGVGNLLASWPEGHVVGHAHVGKERVLLEHGVDVALVGRHSGDVGTLEKDPSRGRLLEAGDHLQRGGLAAAGGSEHGEELTPPDGEVGVLDGDEVAVLLAHVIESDDVAGCRRIRCAVSVQNPSDSM